MSKDAETWGLYHAAWQLSTYLEDLQNHRDANTDVVRGKVEDIFEAYIAWRNSVDDAPEE